MLAMEYGNVVGMNVHKYACSTMSSETLSESCGSRNNRIRTIRLVRSSNHGQLSSINYRHGPSYGFSIRGGREHGTGFFVSHVEMGSEAHNQGLRVGDQIIRINGFTVDDAVHKEILQLISNHSHLTLKVRGVGMIPVKDKKTDLLSWQIVTTPINDSVSPASRESPQLTDKISDVRINIMVAPKSKLGCGICKGPEWKPGIFVQFTKDGGIAREAGLRPGDQILYCNNIDFSDIAFNEAVNLMKSTHQLNLIVRKSAGLELFPGESSGYNSSASSVTGDQSPSWSDSKRLSIVKEENLDLEERLNHLDKYKNMVNMKKWDSWDEEPEEKQIFKPTIINLSENGTTIHNNGSEEAIIDEFSNIYNNSTNNSISAQSLTTPHSKPTMENPYGTSTQLQQKQMKTVVVEVHRSDVDEEENNDSGGGGGGGGAGVEISKKPSTIQNGHIPLSKNLSTSSFCSITSKSSCTSSITSNATNSSLSSAITQEIQRRTQKKSIEDNKPSIDEQLQMKKILKGVSDDKQYQHSKLMDEFKKAHQRMFKTNESTDEVDCNLNNKLENQNLDRLKNNTTTSTNNTTTTTTTNSNINGDTKLSQKLAERLSNLQNGDSSFETKRLTIEKLHNNGSTGATNTPPPPPPPPQRNGTASSASSTSSSRTNTMKSMNKIKPKAPPVPVKYSVLSTNNNNNHHQLPPPCPTPDYDTLSLASTTASNNNILPSKYLKNQRNSITDTVEMESLESFQLNMPNNTNLKPKPPNTYFQKRNLTATLSNQSNTSTIRRSRPISVTIGEYPSMMHRRQPGKLDFLQNSNGSRDDNDAGAAGGMEFRKEESLGSRLTSELTQTLNRSNLRKKTESMENLLGDSRIPTRITNNRNQSSNNTGTSVRISLSNLSKAFTKSTSDLTEDFYHHNVKPSSIIASSANSSRRITMINLNHSAIKATDNNSTSIIPNGILKNNGNTTDPSISSLNSSMSSTSSLASSLSSSSANFNKSLTSQKCITFGEMPKLIKDKSAVKT